MSKVEQEAVSPRAMAAKKPKKGKGSAVLIRVTQATRDALDKEADESGRSLSQIAEMWLDASLAGRATYTARLGGLASSSAIEVLAAAAVEVTNGVGDITASEEARTALLSAWRELLPRIIAPARPSKARMALIQNDRKVQVACLDLIESLKALPPTDPLLAAALDTRLLAPGDLSALDRTGEGRRDQLILAIALVADEGLAFHPGRQARLQEALDVLTRSGAGLRSEVSAAASALNDYKKAIDVWAAATQLAAQRGRDIAKALTSQMSEPAPVEEV